MSKAVQTRRERKLQWFTYVVGVASRAIRATPNNRLYQAPSNVARAVLAVMVDGLRRRARQLIRWAMFWGGLAVVIAVAGWFTGAPALGGLFWLATVSACFGFANLFAGMVVGAIAEGSMPPALVADEGDGDA